MTRDQLPRLRLLRDLVQQDPCSRGLAKIPGNNLITACADDFAAACRSIAAHAAPALAVATGFYIPHANPPAAETDGPPGALFLARALLPLGVRVAILTDGYCRRAVDAGLARCGLFGRVPVLTLPSAHDPWEHFHADTWLPFATESFRPTHLIAIECPGPAHPPLDRRDHEPGTHYNMAGNVITEFAAPVFRLFDSVRVDGLPMTTIGIGDGGNEVGMGKVPRDVICENIARGERIACRTAADHLIVCGISNWGGYALATGVRLLRGAPADPDLYSAAAERDILQAMIDQGPLVDGVLARRSLSVDGLAFDDYVQPLLRMADLLHPVEETS